MLTARDAFTTACICAVSACNSGAKADAAPTVVRPLIRSSAKRNPISRFIALDAFSSSATPYLAPILRMNSSASALGIPAGMPTRCEFNAARALSTAFCAATSFGLAARAASAFSKARCAAAPSGPKCSCCPILPCAYAYARSSRNFSAARSSLVNFNIVARGALRACASASARAAEAAAAWSALAISAIFICT